MKKHFKTLSTLLVLTAVLILPYFVFAQNTSAGEEGIVNRLQTVAGKGGYTISEKSDLTSVAGLIIQAVLGLLGIIFIILMIYAGYTWMVASGNEQQVSKAKNMLQTSVIGLVIVLSSWAIWTFIFESLISGN
jgi:hypothetical protein